MAVIRTPLMGPSWRIATIAAVEVTIASRVSGWKRSTSIPASSQTKYVVNGMYW